MSKNQKRQKLNTHFVDIDKAIYLANKKLPYDKRYKDRQEFMDEIGKHKQEATNWKSKSPEIVSILFKIKEVAGLKSIEEIISKIEDK